MLRQRHIIDAAAEKGFKLPVRDGILLRHIDDGADAHARMASLFVEDLVEQAHEADPVVDEAQGIVETGIPVEEADGDHGDTGLADELDGGVLPRPLAQDPALAGLHVGHGAGGEEHQGLARVQLLQGGLDAVDAGDRGRAPVRGGGVDGDEIGGQPLDPQEERVHQGLHGGTFVAEEVNEADAVQMAVHVVGNHDERALGQLLQPFRVAHGEVYAGVVQDGPGKVRSRLYAAFLYALVQAVHPVYSGDFQTDTE